MSHRLDHISVPTTSPPVSTGRNPLEAFELQPAIVEVAPAAGDRISAAAPPEQRDWVVRQLLGRAERDATARDQLILLAAQCVDIAPDLEPSLRGALDLGLSGLLPPRSLHDAERLAAAGDVAVPMLRFSGAMSTEEARASVRALVRIGSDAALAQLGAGYGEDRRLGVIRELTAGWPAFEADDFAREVMARSPLQRGHLRVLDPPSVAFLQWLDGLRSLDVRMTGRCKDSTLIGRACHLEALDVDGLADWDTLDALRGLEGLRTLRVGDAFELRSLDGIRDLPVAHLAVSSAPELRELSALGGLSDTLVDLELC